MLGNYGSRGSLGLCTREGGHARLRASCTVAACALRNVHSTAEPREHS